MLDVLIVSPHIDYTRLGKPINIDNDFSSILPLGAMSIAQYLNNKNYRVKFIHIPTEFQLRKNTNTTIQSMLKKHPAHICAIQCNWFLYTGGASEIARQYRKLFPKAKIFIGGIHASGFYKEILTSNPSIDGVILGEGERILEQIILKNNYKRLSGLAYLEKQVLILNKPSTKQLISLSKIPVINIQEKDVFPHIGLKPYFYINISRGACPYGCIYCVGNNHQLFPRKLELIPIKQIITQLKIYENHGVREVFMGENQFFNTSFLIKLATEIKRNNFSMTFRLETHPSLCNGETVKFLIDCGFKRFTIGCESGSNRMLSSVQRKYKRDQILKIVKNIYSNGGIALTSWIVNLPDETRSDYLDTLQTMKKVVSVGGLVYWVENLHVLPGSRLFNNPESFHIQLLLRSYRDWRRWSHLAKQNISFNDALNKPEKYLTHINKNVNPKIMMRRFYNMRLLARSLIPFMKDNILRLEGRLPPYLYLSEQTTLSWYYIRGYKMLVF